MADAAAAISKARAYSSMSKAELDAEYDRLRASDPQAARIEGMKMHNAFFKKGDYDQAPTPAPA